MELITNGSLEDNTDPTGTGQASNAVGWTSFFGSADLNEDGHFEFTDPRTVPTGVATGSAGSSYLTQNDAEISQVLLTETLATGEEYTLTFDYWVENGKSSGIQGQSSPFTVFDQTGAVLGTTTLTSVGTTFSYQQATIVFTAPAGVTSLRFRGDGETASDNAFFYLDNFSMDAVCFAAGSRIQTPAGEVPVEKLREGDLVNTLDHDVQVVRWVGVRSLSKAQITANPNLAPIKIHKGALGADLPQRDMLVSPQHRMLISSNLVQRMFGCPEVLIAAKHLVGIDGIELADANEVTYVHFLCDNHEIVICEGAPSETLYLGKQALKTLTAHDREEVFALFPKLREVNDRALVRPARELIGGRRGRSFARRASENSVSLLSLECDHKLFIPRIPSERHNDATARS